MSIKSAIAFLSLVVLGFGACSTTPSKEVTLSACCADHAADKEVTLQDSWAPGGRVVRLAH